MDVAKPKSHHGQPHARGPAGGQTHAQSFLALTALGVVFGDIGTRPLYTLSTASTIILAHEKVVRREKDSAMGPISFAIFSFLNKISSRAPDYFNIPHDGSSKWASASKFDGGRNALMRPAPSCMFR